MNHNIQSEIESIKMEVKELLEECREVNQERREAVLEYENEMKKCLALISHINSAQSK